MLNIVLRRRINERHNQAKNHRFSGCAHPPLTRRDIRLPAISGKATAVIGMRRTGKTTFIWQVIGQRVKQSIVREALLYFNFEDKRLAGQEAANLHCVVEEYYRLNPDWRDQKRVVFILDEI